MRNEFTKAIRVSSLQCSVAGCGRKSRCMADAQPLCHMHYQRWVKYGTINLPARFMSSDGLCMVVGCTTSVRSRHSFYCDAHYYRMRRNSKLGLSQKRQNCNRCGQPLTKNQSKFCSVRCSWRSQNGTPDVKVCPMCSLPFTTRNRAAYCSRECLREAEHNYSYFRRIKTRYAAREKFKRQEIFERDGWICQACNTPVNRQVGGRHPDAPSLDHIIPLSKGGQHTRANTQCTHLMCNFIKQAQLNPEKYQHNLPAIAKSDRVRRKHAEHLARLAERGKLR